MILEVELVVVVVSTVLFGVDGIGGGNVAEVHLNAQGGLPLGVQVVFRPHVVHRSLGVDVVATLVA